MYVFPVSAGPNEIYGPPAMVAYFHSLELPLGVSVTVNVVPGTLSSNDWLPEGEIVLPTTFMVTSLLRVFSVPKVDSQTT